MPAEDPPPTPPNGTELVAEPYMNLRSSYVVLLAALILSSSSRGNSTKRGKYHGGESSRGEGQRRGRERRAGHLRQAPRDRARARRAPVPRPHPCGGRPRDRKDGAR